jgi:hypothetical protein
MIVAWRQRTARIVAGTRNFHSKTRCQVSSIMGIAANTRAIDRSRGEDTKDNSKHDWIDRAPVSVTLPPINQRNRIN